MPFNCTAENCLVSRDTVKAGVVVLFLSASALCATDGSTLCMLICFADDADPPLERLPNSLQSSNIFVWILTHPDLRKSVRVRANLSFFGSRLADAAPKMLGQIPAG